MASGLNILVVEDSDELREVIVETLTAEGHSVQGVGCAEMASFAMAATRFDIVIADLNLPGEDGLSLSRRIRSHDANIGIIMVTARSLPHEKREGYESGADIYLAKPLSEEELCAAITALARRLKPALRQDAVTLDRAQCSLQGPGSIRVELTPNEAALLAGLVVGDGQRLQSAQLIELMCLDRAYEPKAALEIAIVRLRKKLQQAGAPEPAIKAVRNWGYQLCMELFVI